MQGRPTDHEDCKHCKFSVKSCVLVPSGGPKATPTPKRQSSSSQGVTPPNAVLARSIGTFHQETKLKLQQIKKKRQPTCDMLPR